LQRGQLTPSQASEDGEQDERTIPGMNDIGEGEYLPQGKYRPFRRSVLRSALDPAGVPAY